MQENNIQPLSPREFAEHLIANPLSVWNDIKKQKGEDTTYSEYRRMDSAARRSKKS